MLPDPAPVSGRLLPGDSALLAYDYLYAALSQIQGGTNTGDSTTDNNDIRFRRQRIVKLFGGLLVENSHIAITFIIDVGQKSVREPMICCGRGLSVSYYDQFR